MHLIYTIHQTSLIYLIHLTYLICLIHIISNQYTSLPNAMFYASENYLRIPCEHQYSAHLKISLSNELETWKTPNPEYREIRKSENQKTPESKHPNNPRFRKSQNPKLPKPENRKKTKLWKCETQKIDSSTQTENLKIEN